MNAERRRHRKRLKQNRRVHWGRDLTHEETAWSKAVTTPAPCSCWMCGNPRKHFGEETLQERSARGLFNRLGLDG